MMSETIGCDRLRLQHSGHLGFVLAMDHLVSMYLRVGYAALTCLSSHYDLFQNGESHGSRDEG